MTVRSVLIFTLFACSASEEISTNQDNLDSSFGFDSLAGRGRLDGDAPGITARAISISSGTTAVLEARNCTAGTDPVLHLLRGSLEVATDDDSGAGVESQLVFTNNVPFSTFFTVVLRAKGNAVRGSCDLVRDGSLLASQASAGGWIVRLPSLLANEEVETVNRPGGPAARIYLLESDDITLSQRFSGGTAGAAIMSSASALGTRFVVVGATSSGPLRIIRNDRRIADTDQDEVGDELEAALQTCSRTSDVRGNFECSRASDPQDTDGDGINDGWEIFGRRDLTPHQPLPEWGSDPRHKDLFIEVDYLVACNDTSTERRMSAEASRQFADIYADRTRTLSPLIELLRAQQLINPDLTKGINLHFDTGRAPILSTDLTTFGDWGGHNEVPPTTVNGACQRESVDDVWQTQMSLARRGIFHYAFARPGSASNGHHLIYSDWSSTNGKHGAHELGHTLGIGHSGPAYAQNGDPNCRTNYPSIMNYAYYDNWADSGYVSFSDGTTGPTIYNRSLEEQNAVDPSDTDYLGWLEDVFEYNVDWTAGHVDWDRDGWFDDLTTVIAYSNFAPGGQGCEWTRLNRIDSLAGAQTSVTPAVGRLGGRTYVFYADASSGGVKFVYTDDDLNCTEVEDDCGNPSFGGPVSLPLEGSTGVTLAKIRRGTQDRLMIIATDSHRSTSSLELYRSGTSQAWTTPANVPITLAEGEPHAVSTGLFSFYLVHLGVFDRRMYWIRYNTSTGWSSEARAEQSINETVSSLPTQPSGVSPSLMWTYFPGPHTTRGLHAMLSNGTGLEFWRLDTATGYWSRITGTPSPAYIGKPTGLWVRNGPNDRDGQVYVAYRESSNKPKFMRSFGDGNGNWMLGLDSNLDNGSERNDALTCFHEWGFDTALRIVDVKNGNVRLKPNADGTTNLVFRDYSDWEVFAVTLCSTLMRPEDQGVDSQIPDPVDCHPWPYPVF